MKKILSVLLAVSVLTSLTACETMTESASSSVQQDIASASENSFCITDIDGDG